MAKQKKDSAPAPAPSQPMVRLSAITGHAHPRRLLAAAMSENRLPPALLFHGPAGIGKFTTARSVAAGLNCAAPDGADACLECAACRRMASWSHPDVKVLESEAEAQAAGRPVFYPDPQSSGRAPARLLVGQVRRLLRETAFKPFEGGQRVVIIRHLESDPSMGCANALLKALEEPPPATRFILTSSRPDRLPATIRSRCQSLAFLPPSRAETLAFLSQRGMEGEEARLRTALSGSRPGVALALDAQGGLAHRDGILQALGMATSGDATAAVAAAEQLLPAPGEMADLLEFFALVARDLMVLPILNETDALHNSDRLDDLRSLSHALPEHRAAWLLERIGWCQQALERHVHPGLMLQTLLLAAGGHLPADPLADPWLAVEESGA